MTRLAPEDLGTVLGVWAHPDDETYLSAALMTTCVDHGQRVVCVTATRGEGGSMDHERWPPERMGEVRQAELERCLKILGVSEHVWLDYIDGTCHEVDDDEGVARVAALIRDVRPDTVLTFGPEGMTGHEDHKAVHRWTVRAFAEEAAPGARLLFAAITPAWAERFVPMLNRFNVYGPGTPIPVPEEDMAIAYLPPPEIVERKFRAIRAHESQIEGLLAAFGDDGFREALSGEWFAAAP